ncbi:MAG: hypothetical protein K5945_05225 [Bacteroidaceae bacterium]|nr:hypothetical protein [Bacteroidaceae bacterium]
MKRLAMGLVLALATHAAGGWATASAQGTTTATNDPLASTIDIKAVKAQQAAMKGEETLLKKALKYRTDIAKPIQKEITKRFMDVAILHSDWIESGMTKSTDLQGNPLFPEQFYSSIAQRCDSFFVLNSMPGAENIRRMNALTRTVAVGNELTDFASLAQQATNYALFTRSGRQVVPFLGYSDIDLTFLSDGVVLAHRKDSLGMTDVYSLLGQRLCSLRDCTIQSVSYGSYANHIRLEFNRQGDGAHTFAFYYPDGAPACPDITVPFTIDGPDSILCIDRETTYRVAVEGSPDAHPRMSESSVGQQMEADERSFRNNVWVKAYQQHYDRHEYKDALFCIGYYYQHERGALFSPYSAPNQEAFMMAVDCRLAMLQSQEATAMVQGTDEDFPLPEGLTFHEGEEAVTSHVEWPLEAAACTREAADRLNQFYASAIEKAAQQQQERAQRSAFLAAAITMAATDLVTTAIDAKMGSRGSASTSTGSTKPKSATSAGRGTSSSSGSEAQAEAPANPQRDCPVCKGTGRMPHETYMGSATAGQKKYCEYCQEDRYVGHHHVFCSSCKGTGKY